MKSTFWAADPRRPHIWTILRKDKRQRTVEQSSGPQANDPPGYYSRTNTESLKLGYPAFITGMVVYLV